MKMSDKLYHNYLKNTYCGEVAKISDSLISELSHSMKCFRIRNFWSETVLGALPAVWSLSHFFWRKNCTGGRHSLKRSITASRRIRNYEKRLITFGDTVWNVQKLFRERKVVVFQGTPCFPTGKLNSECAFPSKYSTFCTVNNSE